MIAPERTMYARRAIESLRSGVPNPQAVEILGMEEPEISAAFEARLQALIRHDGAAIPGFLIEGEFGTGKSHILRYLEQLSLKRKLAVSSVTISKETPLGDLTAVFRNAILNLTYPDGLVAGTLAEVFERLDTNSERYAHFYRQVCGEAGALAPLFQASMLLYDNYCGSPEIVEQLVSFWDGGPPQIPLWRRLLKDLEAAPKIKALGVAELALQRFRFVALALRAAGFAGWLLTIDEMELIAKLTLPARTKAYVAIDRLFGFNSSNDGSPMHGLSDTIIVGAITTDLVGELVHTRREREFLPRQVRIDEETVRSALAGLEALETTQWRHMIRSNVDLRAKWDSLRSLYATAYAETISDVHALGEFDEATARRNMRQNVRSWIWSWDLRRLDPTYESRIVADDLSYDLSEDLDVPYVDESFESAV